MQCGEEDRSGLFKPPLFLPYSGIVEGLMQPPNISGSSSNSCSASHGKQRIARAPCTLATHSLRPWLSPTPYPGLFQLLYGSDELSLLHRISIPFMPPRWHRRLQCNRLSITLHRYLIVIFSHLFTIIATVLSLPIFVILITIFLLLK